jgi:DNA primase
MRSTAEHILEELPDNDLFENEIVLRILEDYKLHLEEKQPIDKNYFIYHPDNKLSTFVVSLFDFKYQQSPRWKSDKNQAAGYQQKLFQQDYKSFMRTLDRNNSTELEQYLKIEEDKSHEDVTSVIIYLKLKKIKKLLLQNNDDMRNLSTEKQIELQLTQKHLKELEMALTSQLGSVIVK